MIKFGSKAEEGYNELSNFRGGPILLDGKEWATVEHYYQAQKFLPHDPEQAEAIRLTSTPGKAKRMGGAKVRPIREDWEDVKEDVMRRALVAKFSQDMHCQMILLGTRDEELVEYAPWGDYYWGDGGDGTGLNRLGVLLMELRDSGVLEPDE